jgi:hypothetical protein
MEGVNMYKAELRRLSDSEVKSNQYGCAAICPGAAKYVLEAYGHKYYYCDAHKPKNYEEKEVSI